VFAVWTVDVTVRVPEDVTGDPVTEKIDGMLRPTDVTVAFAEMVNDPAPTEVDIPAPAVMKAATGAAPVEPIKTCPDSRAGASTIAPPDDHIILELLRAVPELVPPLAIGRIPLMAVVKDTFP
jgi:hypothetical protein